MSKYINFTLSIVFSVFATYDLFKEGDSVYHLVIINGILLILFKIDLLSEKIDEL